MSNNTDLKVTLNGDAKGFSDAIMKAQADFQKAMDTIGKSSKQAKSDLDAAFSTLNIRMGSQIVEEGNKVKAAFDTIKASATATSEDVSRASEAMTSRIKELNAEANGMSSSMNSAGSGLEGLGGKLAVAGAALVGFGAAMKAVGDITSQGKFMEAQTNVLTVFEGGADLAKIKLESLRETANKTGQSLNDLIVGWKGFAAATQTGELAGAAGFKMFQDMNTAFAGLHVTSEAAKGAMIAVTQSLTKGVVQAEELRGQFAEHIPVSMQKMAEYAGMTIDQMNAKLASGSLRAEEFWPKVFEGMARDMSGAASAGAETLAGKLNILQNTIQEIYQQIAESGFFDAFKAGINSVIETLSKMQADGSIKTFATGVGAALAVAVKAIADFIVAVVKIGSVIGEFSGVATAFAAILGGVWVKSLIAGAEAAIGAAGGLKLLGIALVENTAKTIVNAEVTAAAGVAATGAATGVTALGLAFRTAIPILGGLYIFYEIASLIVPKMIEWAGGLNQVEDAAKKAKEEIKQAMEGPKNVKFDDVAVEVQKAFSKVTATISAEAKTAFTGFNQAGKEMLTEFTKSAEERHKISEQQEATFIASQQQAKDKLKELERQKALDAAQFSKEKTDNEQVNLNKEILAHDNKVKKEHEQENTAVQQQKITALEKAAEEQKGLSKQATQAEVHRQKELLAERKNINDLKNIQGSLASDGFNAVFKQRELDHKRSADAIALREVKLKQQIEEADRQKAEADKRSLAENKALEDQKLAQVEQLNADILKEGLKFAGEYAQNTMEMHRAEITEWIKQTDKVTSEIVKATAAKASAITDNSGILKAYQEQTSLFDKWMGNDVKAIEENGRKMAAAITAGADLAIEAQNSLLGRLSKSHADIESQIKTHTSNIARLQQELGALHQKFADAQVDISLINQTDVEKIRIYRDTYDKAFAEMASINAKAADQKRGLDADETKRVKALEDIEIQAAKNIASAGSDKEKSILSTTAARAEGAEKVAKAEKEAALSVELSIKGQELMVSSLKRNLADIEATIKETMGKVKEYSDIKMKVEIDAKSKDNVELLRKDLETLKTLGSEGTKVKVSTDDALVEIKKLNDKAAEKADKQVKVNADDAAFKSAIADDVRTEHKTIIVDKVAGSDTSGGGGGGYQMNAAGGLITGEGTGTSDSIPSMLSNGEYVIRAAAVQKFGSNFFNALNSGFMPHAANVPRFAEGGLVGASGGSSSRADTVNINLSVGGKAYQMSGAREQAMGLAQALQQLSRAA